jgi:hypothetical protein
MAMERERGLLQPMICKSWPQNGDFFIVVLFAKFPSGMEAGP